MPSATYAEKRYQLDEPKRLRLLEADPDLGESLTADDFADASRLCTVALARLPAGRIDEWPVLSQRPMDPVSAIVLQGLISRRLLVQGRHAVELLGPGDFLRPSALSPDAGVSASTRWRTAEPAVLALLDGHFYERACRYPALLSVVLDRALRRAHSLLVRLAITEIPQAKSRVQLVLWHLADRWGRVAPEGVLLPMHLSRTTLAELVCARRETVSRALTQLNAQGIVLPHERGLLLTGQPPGDGQCALASARATRVDRTESVIAITPRHAQV